jgi:hypothetical protein
VFSFTGCAKLREGPFEAGAALLALEGDHHAAATTARIARAFGGLQATEQVAIDAGDEHDLGVFAAREHGHDALMEIRVATTRAAHRRPVAPLLATRQ